MTLNEKLTPNTYSLSLNAFPISYFCNGIQWHNFLNTQ